mgnify:CR=1 FL=1
MPPMVLVVSVNGVVYVGDKIVDDVKDENYLSAGLNTLALGVGAVPVAGDILNKPIRAAAKKLRKLNQDIVIEELPVSINDYTALDVVGGCDVVIDALDSVNARYSLNKACIEKKIPFVTGAAVGVTGQSFTILPNESACYHCLFPALDEDSMPTCSIEGVHPSILSIIGGIEVSEAVKIITGKEPSLKDKVLHVDLENLIFNFTKVSRVEECSVCGSGTKQEKAKENWGTEERRNEDRPVEGASGSQSAAAQFVDKRRRWRTASESSSESLPRWNRFRIFIPRSLQAGWMASRAGWIRSSRAPQPSARCRQQ